MVKVRVKLPAEGLLLLNLLTGSVWEDLLCPETETKRQRVNKKVLCNSKLTALRFETEPH